MAEATRIAIAHVTATADTQVAARQATMVLAAAQQTETTLATQAANRHVTATAEAVVSAPAAESAHSQATLAGTAFDVLPKGVSDALEVIAVGAYQGYLPFVLRNNSPGALACLEVSLTVRTDDGSLFASGENGSMNPRRLEPGDVAFGHIPLNGIVLPANPVYDFSLDSCAAAPVGESRAIDLEIIDISERGDRIVGEARNSTGQSAEDPVAEMMCFTDKGWAIDYLWEGLNRDTIPPGETGTFQIDTSLYGYSRSCPKYLIAAHGRG